LSFLNSSVGCCRSANGPDHSERTLTQSPPATNRRFAIVRRFCDINFNFHINVGPHQLEPTRRFSTLFSARDTVTAR
jgi:hypothetical protein